MSNTKLKPCPFCGFDIVEPSVLRGCRTTVRCVACGAEGPNRPDTAEADDAWNERKNARYEALRNAVWSTRIAAQYMIEQGAAKGQVLDQVNEELKRILEDNR
jgi:Lar family restriction alleviation protein